MSRGYILDSNILIYAAKPAHDFLDPWIASEHAHLSEISIPEVFGFPDLSTKDEARFEAWFGATKVIGVSTDILRRAAGLRRQHRIKLGDSIIAATALVFHFDLVTRNDADFKHVAGLRLINPFSAGFPI